MNLSNFLDVNRILLGLTADNQETALKNLISPMVKAGLVTDSELLLEDLKKREAEITTVMDNGVAIPHARSHSVNRLTLVVAIAGEKGIRFNPENECHLIFCIAIPHFAPTSHLPLLQLLAKFSYDSKRVKKVLSYKTITGVSKYLSSFNG